MKFTLDNCLSRINQILNYPSVAYEDVSHYFDQAIEELNTTLRIALPTVSEMVSDNTFSVYSRENLVRLHSAPTTIPAVHPTDSLDQYASDGYVYVCDSDFSKRKFYKFTGTEWIPFDNLYGIDVHDNKANAYLAVPITTSFATWNPVPIDNVKAFDITEYLPMAWWTLFVIPYVCFKFSVRNGDSGELFVDEFTQGFQQLQSSYNVPNTVCVKDVAGLPAYSKAVEAHLNNLLAHVPTRAIFDSMRVGNGIQSVFGGFYETGGWGI